LSAPFYLKISIFHPSYVDEKRYSAHEEAWTSVSAILEVSVDRVPYIIQRLSLAHLNKTKQINNRKMVVVITTLRQHPFDLRG